LFFAAWRVTRKTRRISRGTNMKPERKGNKTSLQRETKAGTGAAWKDRSLN
jgi:hypothetical protein